MGNFQSTISGSIPRQETRAEASISVRKRGMTIDVIDVDSDQSSDEAVTECVSVEEHKRLVESRDGDLAVLNGPGSDVHLQEAKVLDSPSGSLYKELLESSECRDSKPSLLDFELRSAEQKISASKLKNQEKEANEDVSYGPFVPLTDVEEDYVSDALFGLNRQQLLVVHDNSNIEITREVLQCLRPGGWLNDEVINLYLELLKEREKRAPQKFLKCHFFNTSFCKKLISGRSGYDYKAVRRWTTQKKIGYGLVECDKIFVPVHKNIHWCLAVINIKDEKFQYLDSLGGRDPEVLKALARYFVEEVKDKSNMDLDVRSWKQEFVDDLPEQKNGWDCGMFMIKYVDFYSRGLTLCFKQDHIPYFRKRTALEILRLRAE